MNILAVSQVVVSIALVALILLQERSSGLSGIFGGESTGPYQTRRGLEKIILWATVVLAIAFVAMAAVQLFLK